MTLQLYDQVVESDTETHEYDSQEDPTFDILENTLSLSNLSINKKSTSLVTMEPDSITAPEFDADEEKSFEIVLKIIEGGQVEKLKVEQCKLYLRRHGLRLTGKKDILIQRIKEHLSIMNGEGEQKYPASSFVMNCKGDACTGDVVMFEQNVYEVFNIASRSASGPPCGQRIVAGRIVKESYGAAKQQHTFTLEVLWSKGTKPLPPLHPLLIKGRNLYRLKTMRQRWEDESERHKILSEKHARGNVARTNREARLHEKEMKKALRESRASKGNIQNEKEENQRKASPTRIKNEKQEIKRKASPTRPIDNARTSTQHSGAPLMGSLGNCPLTGMDDKYHGAQYKENMNLNNLRSIDGPSRGMHSPLRNMDHGAQYKENTKPNTLRGISSPLRKSFHVEQSTRFYPPRLDYDMNLNNHGARYKENMSPKSLRGISSPLRRSFHVEQNTSFYPPKHDYDPHSAAKFFCSPRHDNVAKNYSFQQVSYLSWNYYQGKRQQLCRYHAQGGCRHGTNCKYLH